MIDTSRFFYEIISFFILLSSCSIYAQRIDHNQHYEELACRKENANLLELTDETYDVKHYHIDVEISIDTEYISGSVFILADAVEDLTTISLDLDNAYTILSIDGASSYTFNNNEIEVTLENPVLVGDEFSLKVYYQGVPPLAGGYKGLRYETHNGGEPVIVSLSTPYLAHTWWPCNDGTKDKADSVFIDITIDDTIISGNQLQAISNGLLDEVENLTDDKLKFKWKHNYPIVPYYVMVAISNYHLIEQTYDNGTESFPLKYYVFNSSISQATAGVSDIPNVMDFFSDIFGPYPFADEKYGMTELGFYGGIENQTNTIINNMSLSWFMVSVHELAHMWFADMITCSDWHHGWLNEGFASYAEALWVENSDGINAYHNYVQNFEYYNGGSVYLDDVSDPFNVFQNIIYNKGAYILHMLRHVLGDTDFFEAVHEYATNINFQYDLATTEDFQQVCEQISGKDLTNFFSQWIYDEYYPKYQFDYYQDNEFNTVLGILQTQENSGWRPIFNMPIDVKFNFDDGTETTLVVDNNLLYQTFDFSFDKEITAVTLDPDKWILANITQGDFNLSTDDLNALENDFVIYPNPAQNILIIKSINTLEVSRLKFFNSLGVLIENVNLENRPFKSYNFNTSKLTAGVYFLELQVKGSLISKKFVVK